MTLRHNDRSTYTRVLHWDGLLLDCLLWCFLFIYIFSLNSTYFTEFKLPSIKTWVLGLPLGLVFSVRTCWNGFFLYHPLDKGSAHELWQKFLNKKLSVNAFRYIFCKFVSLKFSLKLHQIIFTKNVLFSLVHLLISTYLNLINLFKYLSINVTL